MARDKELDNLKSMYSRGLITYEEFGAAKGKLRPESEGSSGTSMSGGGPTNPAEPILRDRNRKMIKMLAEQGKKYNLALSGDRWAYASILGTESWEDYVSLSTRAMQLETTTSIDERLERIELHMERSELLLEKILESLREGQERTSPASTDRVGPTSPPEGLR